MKLNEKPFIPCQPRVNERPSIEARRYQVWE